MVKIAVIQFPGSNCEEETNYACLCAGIKSEIFHWLKNPDKLDDYGGFIIPGGFSYQDRVRAGAIASKLPVMEKISELAFKGRAVYGICNGAQILIEAGLIPGIHNMKVDMALAKNSMKNRWGFFHKFVYIKSTSKRGTNLINQTIEKGEIIPIPIAHAEGRFTTNNDEIIKAIEEDIISSFKYCNVDGVIKDVFPVNPNGSIFSLSAISNKDGNIVAMMPHPERCSFLKQIPLDLPGEWGQRRREHSSLDDRAFGPGMKIFKSIKIFLEN
jgi:phosphoribosylformylglycinamidine synthase